MRAVVTIGLTALCLSACSDPDAARLRRTTIPTYDKKTGRLTGLTYDRNKNGVIDTWTEMDGNKPLRAAHKDFRVKKPGIEFRVSGRDGEEISFDNLRVWELK